ncbi:DNA topoisomerase [Lipomyces kononenkoae]|uniref:DNA topoisomerase n=1 Tax=Lipomyces kononenkoae TaxID=34357 RepID=A0ACC3SYD1_LIPKO
MAQVRVHFGHLAALFISHVGKHNRRALKTSFNFLVTSPPATIVHNPQAIFCRFRHSTAGLSTTESQDQEMARDVISLSSEDEDWNDGDYSPVAIKKTTLPRRAAATASKKRTLDVSSEVFDFDEPDDDDDFEMTPPKKTKLTQTTKKAPVAKDSPVAKKTTTSVTKRAAVTNDSNADEDKLTAKPAAKPVAKPRAKGKPLKPRENEMSLSFPSPVTSNKMDADFDRLSSSPAIPKPLAQNENIKSKTSSETYQKLTQLEHILKRPDTYIGSIEYNLRLMWTFNKDSNVMEYKSVRYVPGLYKIFDEILVNAADNKVRDPNMDTLKVSIDEESGQIVIYNNGRGIPIEMHEHEKMYIPELIFGNLLTSSNYDDDEKKVTGGRNGYGAKLCNIFSTEFIVETADKNTKKKYKQVWTSNMGKVGKPKITENSKGDEYTKISFKPDLKLFGMTKLDDDLIGIMMRRVYDLAGSVRNIKVYLNNERLKIRNFKQYIEMYVNALSENVDVKDEVAVKASDSDGEGDDKPAVNVLATAGPKPVVIHEIVNDRWEIGFAVSDGSFNQVSFVNSIATTSGGTHVTYVCDQIVNKLTETLKKKNKSGNVKPQQIRNNIFLFVNCQIENPAFTSQTKEQLTTRPSAFGSKCVLPDEFFKKIQRTSIIDNIMDIATRNADKELKKTDGSKRNRITGLVKLDDANKAGTREGHKCTLILTEGDSAKALAVAGLSVVGRDYYGVYPLRGKLLNVREASHDQIMKNAEIQAIKQIMGLQHKKHYTSTKDLRYGHLMIFTDQDHDGSHIKGLLINFLESTFPGLLDIPGFLIEFITPIVKVTVTKGKQKNVIPFYTMPEYEFWKETEGKNCVWKHKYYKGLGTSSSAEGREYFQQLDRHLKEFHAIQSGDRDLIDLAFSKKKADERKEWLRLFKPGTHLDPALPKVPIADFINKELILFSMADNIRSIPSVLDGLKPGQRKVLFGCFKRNLKTEIRVAQLAGYVSEQSAYHHGEQSLIQTIVSMAQDFVGSNNLNLLLPNGCFGTRATGGKDASAPRYIFTELTPLTRKIFHVDDEPTLNYLTDDDKNIEPEWYLPVIPMILVNGADGIGTGWSTSIPNYNPVDIVNNIRRMMTNEELIPMDPWYRNWHGAMERIAPDKYKVSGTVRQVDANTVEITELPIRQWTATMKEFLLAGMTGTEKSRPWIKDMIEQHAMDIKFVVQLGDEEMRQALSEGLLNKFKLTSTISLNNMVAFDASGRIRKYESVEDILRDFYYVRLDYYQRRKDHLQSVLNNHLDKLSSQARFVKLIIDKHLTVSNRKRAELVMELKKLKFPPISKTKKFGPLEDDEALPDTTDENESDAEESSNIDLSSYDYLLGMPIWSLTRERYEKLLRERDSQEQELNNLLKKSAKDMWSHDLDEFEKGWNQFLEQDEINRNSVAPSAQSKKPKRKIPK